MMTDVSHADCTDQLTAFQTGLLPETEGEVIAEHLGSCPNCRIFSEQIDETSSFLEALPQPEAPPQLVARLTSLARQWKDARSAWLLAEDLVQGTFLAAVERDPAVLDFAVLARDLTDTALADQQPESRGLEQFDLGGTTSMLDPDGDTAELFYPDFYKEGPDIGQFIDSPRIWGRTNTLTPEEDYATGELYGIVDEALGQLPAPLGQLIQLVDIDQLSLPEAAAALRLSLDDAVSALHRARVHVRGVIDDFLG